MLCPRCMLQRSSIRPLQCSVVTSPSSLFAARGRPCTSTATVAAASETRLVVAAAAYEAPSQDSQPSPSGPSDEQTHQLSASFSESEQRQLWDSVSRALLKLGKTGVLESHARSLSELAASHCLVKVQLNGVKDNPEAAEAAAAELERQAAGAVTLLQVKGSTMLFGNSSSSKEELLAVAAAEAAGTAAWRAKRKVAAGERAQQKALSEAKRAANASRSRKKIGGIITAVSASSKGPLDKSTLASEWQQLASEIAAVEAAEQSKGQHSSAGGSGSRKRAPWKQQ